jgi:hypothetical protein
MLPVVLLAVCAPGAQPKKPALPVDGARKVIAAVVVVARQNNGAARPRRGDELTAHYIGAAAVAARKLPPEQSAPAFLLGIAVALDTSALLRKNPVTGRLWARLESEAERKVRLKVLGEPTVHARHDLAQHFVVSAGLTASSGTKAAEAAGILKEVLDSHGDSGFSFADLAADLGGIAFADRLLRQPKHLAGLEKGFATSEYVLPPRGLPEGLTSAEFEKRYGSTDDARFRKALEDLRKRTKGLKGYRTP